MAGQSVEFATLRSCKQKLELALESDRDIANFLGQKVFIQRHTYEEIDNPKSMLSSSEKAGLLVRGILNKVELNRKNYRVLMDYFSEDEEKYGDIIGILNEEFDRLTLGNSSQYQTTIDTIQKSNHFNQHNVMKEIQEFEERFSSLAYKAQDYLQEHHTNVKKFRHNLTLLPLNIKEQHLKFLKDNFSNFKNAEDLDDIFYHLNLYWNFFDYGLLEYIINKLCDEGLKLKMSLYSKDMEKFRKRTSLSELMKNWQQPRVKIPPHFKEVVTRLNHNAEECTLEYLDNFRRNFCANFSLYSFILMFHSYTEGSLVINWLIPSEITSSLSDALLKQTSSFFEAHGVLSVTIDGKFVYMGHVQTPTKIVNENSYGTQFSEVVFEGESIEELKDMVAMQIESTSKNQEWALKITTPTKKKVTVRCNRSVTISALKASIKKSEGIPIANQELTYRITDHTLSVSETKMVVLENPQTLEECGICDGQELLLNHVIGDHCSPTHQSAKEVVDIFVKTFTGEQLSISINENSNVLQLKDHLHTLLQIPKDSQKLIFYGKELQDQSTLKSYKLVNKSTIHLIQFGGRVVHIQTLDGRIFDIECQVHEDTIGRLKALIHNTGSIPPDEQFLVFCGNLLKDDNKILSEYNVKNGDLIKLVIKPGEHLPLETIKKGKLYIKAFFHLPIKVSVCASDTISSLKRRVNEELDLDMLLDHLQLRFQGNDFRDDQVLGELGLHDGDLLHLLFDAKALRHVTIKTATGDNLTFNINVSTSDTVSSLKAKIHEQEGILPEVQRIIYAGRELDAQKTLGDLKIQNGAELYLICLPSRQPVVHIKTLAGRELMFKFMKDSRVSCIKSYIQMREGIPSNQQYLMFRGGILQGDKTLKEYGIEGDSTVYLYAPEHDNQSGNSDVDGIDSSIYIKIFSLEKSIRFEYDPDETIKSLKLKLYGKENISPNEQDMYFDGELLDDNRTVGDYGISKGGAIDLITKKQLSSNVIARNSHSLGESHHMV